MNQVICCDIKRVLFLDTFLYDTLRVARLLSERLFVEYQNIRDGNEFEDIRM